MNEFKVNTFFVSEKISKIRWVPEKLKESERFLTGSWDMPKNFVRFWRLHKNEYADEYNEYTPKCSDKIAFPKDITGLEFVDDDMVAASCADGHITLLNITRAIEEDTLKEKVRSPLLHKFNANNCPAPCTGISIYNKDIASIGEDGRLNIFNVTVPHQIYRTIEADSCSLTAVAYINPQEVITANRMGVIRIFDIRVTAEKTEVNSFEAPTTNDKNSNFVSCITSYPTQPHIVFAGTEEGTISIWDLRNISKPFSYLSAHNSPITEMGFHHAQPTKFYSAAEDGEVWLWLQKPYMNVPNTKEAQAAQNANPWLSGERTKNHMELKSLISDIRKSINSVDARGSKVICGSDSEAVYIIDDVF